jgi:hypothetical protein
MAGSVVTKDMMDSLQAVADGCRLVSRAGSKELVLPETLLAEAKLKADRGRLKSKRRYQGRLEVLLLAMHTVAAPLHRLLVSQHFIFYPSLASEHALLCS